MIAALTLSAAGLIGITQYEGFRQNAYNDGTGTTTIGFGSTAGVKPGDKITVERALVLALKDAEKHGEAIKPCIKVPLYQYEWDSYVSLAFNIGPSAFCKSTVVKLANEYDYAGACVAIERFNKVRRNGQKEVSRGLVKRRAAERAMCEGKTAPKMSTIEPKVSTPVPAKTEVPVFLPSRPWWKFWGAK